MPRCIAPHRFQLTHDLHSIHITISNPNGITPQIADVDRLSIFTTRQTMYMGTLLSMREFRLDAGFAIRIWVGVCDQR